MLLSEFFSFALNQEIIIFRCLLLFRCMKAMVSSDIVAFLLHFRTRNESVMFIEYDQRSHRTKKQAKAIELKEEMQ